MSLVFSFSTNFTRVSSSSRRCDVAEFIGLTFEVLVEVTAVEFFLRSTVEFEDDDEGVETDEDEEEDSSDTHQVLAVDIHEETVTLNHGGGRFEVVLESLSHEGFNTLPQERHVEADHHQAGVGDGEAAVDTREEEDRRDQSEEEEDQEGDVRVDVGGLVVAARGVGGGE